MLAGSLTLGKRIALLVVLSLTLVISLFGFLSLRGLQESSDRAVQERLVATQLTARHIDDFLGLYLDVLGQAVDSESANLLGSDPASRAGAVDRLRHRRGGIMAHAVFLAGPDGGVLWAEPSVNPADHPVQLETAIAAAVLENGREAVSNAFVDDFGRVLVSLGVPLHGQTGALEGAVVEVLDLSDPLLNGFVQPVSLGTTGYAEIVDSNGLVLASNDPSRLFHKTDHTDQFAAMIRSGRPTVGACHSCHEGGGSTQPDILAFSPLSLAPWGVAIRQSEEEALGPIHNLQRLLLIGGAGSILVAMWVVWLASRSVVFPIRTLTVAAQRIAQGDLDKAIDRRGPAEVGELAGAFDEMRVKLKASLENLEQVNSTLESRVEQRTTQLAALLDVSKLLASTLDLRRLLDAAVARAADVLDLADIGAVYLYDARRARLEVRGSWGYDEAIMMISLARGEGTAGLAFARGKPLLLESAEAIQQHRATLSVENRAWLAQATLRFGTPTSLMALPLVVKGSAIGAMLVGHHGDSRIFSPSDLLLAQALADQIAVAVENARLYEEVRESERLRGELLEKVISAQEEERGRIARELHDDTCQSLAVLAIRLEDVEVNLPESAVEARTELARLKSQVSGMLREVRTIAYNLRPSILDDLGLTMAIDWYSREQVAKRGVDVSLDVDGMADRHLPPAVETVLFRITQEALSNVVKHSGASRAVVRLRESAGKVVLEVEDDGLGFDVERALRPNGPRGTLGLHGMIERARLSGGHLVVASSPGEGTLVRLELPVRSERENGHEEDHSLVGGRSQTA